MVGDINFLLDDQLVCAEMKEIIPQDIETDLKRACELHLHAVSDYEKCTEFSRLMSSLLARLEDAKCFNTADRVMSILLDCNPKTGAHCEKANAVSQRTRRLPPNELL